MKQLLLIIVVFGFMSFSHIGKPTKENVYVGDVKADWVIYHHIDTISNIVLLDGLYSIQGDDTIYIQGTKYRYYRLDEPEALPSLLNQDDIDSLAKCCVKQFKIF
jgi:hypothetical protein